MSNDPLFDPIFNTAPQPQQGAVVPERARFLFDGWSYKPLVTETTDAQAVPVLEPKH